MSKLPEYPHFNMQTPELRQHIATIIATIIAAIPPEHLLSPVKNELFTNPENAFIRLRDWGFIQGILLVKESASTKRGR